MSWIDWTVLLVTLFSIVAYGTWKTKLNKDLKGYLKGDNSENWATIGLSIMATQASAITFLSTPGQAYESGMGFVQFYFGLPLAMIFISVFILPIYYRLKVYTAYQYLEERFDVKVRSFTAFLFLLSRGLAAGITIYAPAIILSTLLDWNLQLTCILIGGLVIIYTVSGGSRAVSLTQKWQMGIIMTGMFIAFYYVLNSFPEGIGMSEGVDIAGALGKMNIIDLSIDPENRYTLFSGLTGGLFLFISYFGTDQSQVQRYLGGKSLKESRLGLMFNGLMKIPMQFFILFIGVMVFVSFQFNKPPIVFNQHLVDINTEQQAELSAIENAYDRVFEEKKLLLSEGGDLHLAQQLQLTQDSLRTSYKEKLTAFDPNYEQKDSDYIFLGFILEYLPPGLIGLLLAVIFSAAMSSTAGELNALSSTTTIDFYKKFWSKSDEDKKDVRVSKMLTIIWGVLAIVIALTAGLFENLIQLVNILGSLFYGTILGVFLLAFFFKKVGHQAALIAGIIGQLTVLIIHVLKVYEFFELSYLMYNIIGSTVVVIVGILIQQILPKKA
ncbi:transporter, SSS family [Lishizhenia tianjinensis]|uniref:Transporter, SSS family n=1 Tax=Lishizhenia tianjinensis TaxID=477690 RepID=A0A1I6XJF3_9FLAO|nr:sodium:solute symporter [Lishizhenia tianjinensis]SFT38440.1 transporter, SSS family [Lishizhenia tianjinensis]